MDRKYDTYVPSALPSASLGRRRPPIGGARAFGDDEPTDDLEKAYVQWNTRIDKEVKAVVDGLGDLVRLADVSNVRRTSRRRKERLGQWRLPRTPNGPG